jgi:PTS system nitrogen regulatory IIA component
MQLTVRDLADLLNVPEQTIHEWIQEKGLPARRVNDQYRFNRTEVLDWAARRRVTSGSTRIFRVRKVAGEEMGSSFDLVEAVTEGGVLVGIPGHDEASVLRYVVDRMRLPEGTDRSVLVDLLLSRKDPLNPVGAGIAIPHARCPIVLEVARPIVVVGYLETPLQREAPDGRPISTIITLVTPTPRAHLQILAQLSAVLREEAPRRALASKASLEELVAELRRAQANPSARTEA